MKLCGMRGLVAWRLSRIPFHFIRATLLDELMLLERSASSHTCPTLLFCHMWSTAAAVMNGVASASFTRAPGRSRTQRERTRLESRTTRDGGYCFFRSCRPTFAITGSKKVARRRSDAFLLSELMALLGACSVNYGTWRIASCSTACAVCRLGVLVKKLLSAVMSALAGSTARILPLSSALS